VVSFLLGFRKLLQLFGSWLWLRRLASILFRGRLKRSLLNLKWWLLALNYFGSGQLSLGRSLRWTLRLRWL
jgi:hypothetical protein